MFGRSWGVHYTNGDLVLAKFPDGEFGLMFVMSHTGDFHHRSVRVHIQDDAEVPQGHVRLRADPADVYYSYWAGPVVAHLDPLLIMSLAAGIDVPDFERNISAKTILEMQYRLYRGPYKAT